MTSQKTQGRKFQKIERRAAYCGRKSSISVSLTLSGIVLLPLLHGCIFTHHEALPPGDLKYFSTTGAFGGVCVARELCNASFGLRECSHYARYAIPAFDTLQECETAFKGTSLAVQCVDMEFGSPGVKECEPRVEKVTVELDDESSEDDGNTSPATQETDLETMECKNVAPATTVRKLYVPEAGHSWLSSAEMGSDTAGWFGGLQNAKTGRELLPFEMTEAARKGGYNSSAKVSGYFVRGTAAPFSQDRINQLQASLSACPEVASNAALQNELGGLVALAKSEAAQQQSLSAGGNGADNKSLPNSQNEMSQRQSYAGSSMPSFWTTFWFMQAIRPNVYGSYYSPWGSGYGYGFSRAPSYLSQGVTGNSGIFSRSQEPVAVSKPGVNGNRTVFEPERVQAGVSNKQAISNASYGNKGGGSASKPVVKSSSLRSGGFGSSGKGGSSYHTGGSRSSFSGRGGGGSSGGKGGGSFGG